MDAHANHSWGLNNLSLAPVIVSASGIYNNISQPLVPAPARRSSEIHHNLNSGMRFTSAWDEAYYNTNKN
jgi:hypothetical protein